MLAQTLAQIHSQYTIYASPLIEQRVETNIIQEIHKEPQLRYLADFYENYLESYKKSLTKSLQALCLTGDARSTDLPFLGPDVVKTGRAKYMFVFVGSLQSPSILSTTVLSCFWLLETPNDLLMRKFWPKVSTYHRIVRDLGITPEIANKVYVTDVFRIGNKNKNPDARRNRALLFEEIGLLNPDLVVLVGSLPRYIVGDKRMGEDKRIVHVPFPADAVPKVTQEMAPLQYQKLREQLARMER